MSIERINSFELFASGDRAQPDDELTHFFGDITTMYATAVVQETLRQPEALGPESRVVAEELCASLESQRPAKPLWDLSLGQVRHAMVSIHGGGP
jgi:hypothetical protein